MLPDNFSQLYFSTDIQHCDIGNGNLLIDLSQRKRTVISGRKKHSIIAVQRKPFEPYLGWACEEAECKTLFGKLTKDRVRSVCDFYKTVKTQGYRVSTFVAQSNANALHTC